MQAGAFLLLATTLLTAQDLEHRYRSVIRHLEPAGPSSELSDAINGLGTLYFDSGDYPRALRLSERALQVEQTCPKPRPLEVARRLGNIGAALGATNRRREAAVYVLRAIAIYEQQGACAEAAYTLNTMGTLALKSGQSAEAAAYLERAYHLFDGRPADQAVVLGNLALAHGAARHNQLALDYWRRATTLAEIYLPEGRQRAALLLGYAAALRRAGQREQSTSARRTGEAMLDSTRTAINLTVDRSDFHRP